MVTGQSRDNRPAKPAPPQFPPTVLFLNSNFHTRPKNITQTLDKFPKI